MTFNEMKYERPDAEALKAQIAAVTDELKNAVSFAEARDAFAKEQEIEKHVAGSSVFLLFVTNNSQNSKYIGMNEVPWGVSYGKPFIKCILDEGTDVLIPGSNPLTTVTLEGVRDALSATDGLVKGEKRVAKGITVTFSPRNRMIASFLHNDTLSEEKKFAYCLYSQQGAKHARSILYEIKNSGCRVYDAVLDG